MSIEEFHDLIYRFKLEVFEKGQQVMTQNQLTDRMFIVESGKLMCTTSTTYLENLRLVELGAGSILDHRNVLIDQELVCMSIKAETSSNVWSITKAQLDIWKAKYPGIGRQIDIHISEILKKQKRYIIDVVQSKSTDGMLTRSKQRLNVFKNVAFQCMLNYRVQNKVDQLIYQRVKTKIKQLKDKGIPVGDPKAFETDQKTETYNKFNL